MNPVLPVFRRWSDKCRWTLKVAAIKTPQSTRYTTSVDALPKSGRTLISTMREFRTEKFAGLGGYTRDANTDTVQSIIPFFRRSTAYW